MAGSLYMKAHKSTAETISSAPAVWIALRSVCWSVAAQRKWSCVHRWEPTAPPLTETLVKMCVFVCAALSLHLHLSQSVFRYGRSSMHVPNLCVCVCVWENTAWLLLLTLALWQSEHSAVLMSGSPALPAPLWRMNINNSKWSQSRLPLRLLPITPGWADIAVAWKATDRKKLEVMRC